MNNIAIFVVKHYTRISKKILLSTNLLKVVAFSILILPSFLNFCFRSSNTSVFAEKRSCASIFLIFMFSNSCGIIISTFLANVHGRAHMSLNSCYCQKIQRLLFRTRKEGTKEIESILLFCKSKAFICNF